MTFVISVSRVEKVVNLDKYIPYTLDRFREIDVKFVFLRAGAVRWYCPRAKNEKRQTAVRIRYPYRCFLLESLCQNGTARMPSPTKENAILHAFVLAWFSRLYRQPENPVLTNGILDFDRNINTFRRPGTLPALLPAPRQPADP